MKPSNDDRRQARLEEQWRAWVESEPRLDEDALRAALPFRLPPRRRRRLPIVLLAAAASVVLAVLALRVGHLLDRPGASGSSTSRPALVHRLDSHVVLFVSKDSEPLYIVLADDSAGTGDRS